MKRDNSGKMAIHEKNSLLSIVYTNSLFCRFIISMKCLLTPTLHSKVQNRNDGKT